ncbi:MULTISPECIES: hypothetical protein [unclassified Bradyrhizobium]
MENLIIVPRDVLQRAYDALEEIEDRFRFGSDTYILANQIDCLLNPDVAFKTPIQKMEA